MRQQPYNQQVIIQYLLGTLSEAETERFDELSFTDDGFIETLKSAENDLIDAYVNGDLERQFLDQFESLYLRSPERRKRVELAQGLIEQGRRFASPVAQNQFGKSPTQHVPSEKSFPFLAGWAWRTGLAAASIILAALAWLIVHNSQWFRARQVDQLAQEASEQSPGSEDRTQPTRPQQPSATPQAPVNRDEGVNASPAAAETGGPQNKSRLATIILSPQMRGATETPAASVAPRTEYLDIRLELEPNDYSIYKILLIDQAGGPVLWRSARLSGHMRDDGKVLELRLPARLFKPRSYVLRVSGLSDTGMEEIISDYPFRVVK